MDGLASGTGAGILLRASAGAGALPVGAAGAAGAAGGAGAALVLALGSAAFADLLLLLEVVLLLLLDDDFTTSPDTANTEPISNWLHANRQLRSSLACTLEALSAPVRLKIQTHQACHWALRLKT